jgi:hypothetical protein
VVLLPAVPLVEDQVQDGQDAHRAFGRARHAVVLHRS